MTTYSEDEPCNLAPAGSSLRQVVARGPSRRSVLAGGLGAAATFLIAGGAAATGGGPLGGSFGGTLGGEGSTEPLLGFAPIDKSLDDAIRVPAGYTAVAFIPWGTPIVAPYPEFVPGANTAEEQACQIGMHHDGMHYFPLGRNANSHGLLVLNHEYTDELHLQYGTRTGALPPPAEWTLEQVRKSQAAHGVAVVEIARQDGQWQVVRGAYNRRITANTPMTFTGPARGHRLLRTAADPEGITPVGTFNNCANGYTPWKTYLTCEENFNGYFRVDLGTYDPETAALNSRYGVGGDNNRWATNDPRFVVTPAEPHEPNRHGWVVEINPHDPNSTPKKRTALGRFKHEGAWVVEGKGGQAVVYMGDDQVNEYVYKYVGRRSWKNEVLQGRSPLDDGILYVAKFNDDGTGVWVPLVQGVGPLTPANGFADQGDVLVKTRLAASLTGATTMDRPEWVATNPNTSRVYLTCTNNTNPGKVLSAANPRKPNPNGHILCWEEARRDHAATTFVWNLLELCGAGVGSGDGSTIQPEDAHGSPDGLWVDEDGRMWIQTDGTPGAQPGPGGGNNQMLAADLRNRPDAAPGSSDAVPEIRRFLTGPKGCEITGVITTPDKRTMFINVQHPGEDGHVNPARLSDWPYGGGQLPRPATVIITKDDGGVIGT